MVPVADLCVLWGESGVVDRITHALFTAAASMSDRCQEILAAVLFLHFPIV
jgi:hypothetical protein